MSEPTVGFSTGALAEGDFRRALEMLDEKRADAVELSALRAVELPGLLEAISSHIEEYRNRYTYVAFHAPTDYRNERELVEKLQRVAAKNISIVVHPDIIRNVSLWTTIGSCLCIENMDSRKNTGRTANELRFFFEQLPEARLCFDIAHARQVDPTMTEAERILSEFRGRLAHVHLSEVNGKGKHFAASFAAKLAYKRFAKILSSVPVILESPVDEEGIDFEIEETRSLLSNSRLNAIVLDGLSSDHATF